MPIGHSPGGSLDAAQPFKLVGDHWADEMHHEALDLTSKSHPSVSAPASERNGTYWSRRGVSG